jgi:regulator of CtrA degradation
LILPAVHLLFAVPVFLPLCHNAEMAFQESGNELTSKLVDSLYVEAMVLADEARAYFDKHGRDDRLDLDPVTRVAFSCESLKVTTRLMHIIAWLMTQRAREAGEPMIGDPAERRLGNAAPSDEMNIDGMPEQARALIEASSELYDRVRRLDLGSAGSAPAPSPARSLLSRLQRSI